MAVDRVKFQDIVENQFPRYVLEDFPLLPEFVKQYYKSQEYQGGTFDLIQNIDQYVKIDELFSLKTSTTLNGDLDYTATTIPTAALTNFTEGFPETNGLIKIDDEIIHYESISNNSFINCTRGFSGVTTYVSGNKPDQLTFESTEIDEHESGSTIHNLNIIFLQEFFKKIKNQIAPGFNERPFFDGINQRNFLYNVDSFYKSKGTDQSFKILFRALYGEEVEIIKPSEFLFRPSDADYKVTQDFVVEQIIGDPLLLKNLTLFQDSTGARGSISDVQQINYEDGRYYQISIDYGFARDISVKGSVFGEFKPNPKTKILNNIGVGATIIDVDSTIGFPQTGKLIVENSIGDQVAIAYTGKNINQFFNCTGVDEDYTQKIDIRLDDNSYGYVGLDTSKPIEVRITSTLKEFKLNNNSYFYNENDTINIQSLGIVRGDERSQNWYSNVKTQWNIQSIDLIDELELSYQITVKDDHFLRPGYNIILISNSGLQLPGQVTRSSGEFSFVAKLAANVGSIAYNKVENQLLKGNSGKYPYLNSFVGNVQNVYQKYNGDVAVASNSLPNYSDTFTDPYDKKITFSGSSESDNETLVLTNNIDHGFLTGDAIIYKPGIIRDVTISPNGIEIVNETESKFEGIDGNVYYVNRLNQNSIKLSRSRSDIYSGKYVTLIGDVVDNEFIFFDFFNKKLEPQSIVREVLTPDTKSGNYLTEPGYNGILINGVEILNYKSGESLKYGDLRSLEITSAGEGYDIVNPPVLEIVDTAGSGAEGTVSINGQLSGINLIDRGFGYVDVPTVTITGGNPVREAKAEVNMTSIIHTLSFNSELTSRQINIGNNTIGFTTFHKLNLGDKVSYDAKDGTPIVGLTTNAYYYVELVDTSTIKLHTSEENARSGINTVDITSFGTGIQQIIAVGGRNVVSSIFITDPGEGYKNNQRTIPVAGINTAQNRFTIPNHGYNSTEIIKYSTTSSGIVGLSTTEQYYIRKIDDDTFSLSLVGSGATDKRYFYDNDILVDVTTIGNGSFNYLPIQVNVQGTIGINTVSGQDFQCKVQPLFRGTIQAIDLTSSGVGYGSSEIVNFNRQPNINFNSGSGAQLTPIISNGRVVDVIVNEGGTGYNSPPNLIITGDGDFCQLTPIVDNGVITSVQIMRGGQDYVSGATNIRVESAGKFGIADAIIRDWTINTFERNFDNIEGDDGFVSESIDDTSLEYCHVYAPRPLRETTYVIDSSGVTQYGIADLTLSGGIEGTNSYHSPIIGWAYDGNPIYGPYGFTDPQGGNISQMVSGYELRTNPQNRPPTSLFPLGYFIEDYIFTDRGNLDEHNGRFCVTPDYPNGRYCYFSTLNTFTVDSAGPFKNFKRPVFPYLIGNSFYSKPNLNNFQTLTNQNDYDFENGEWFRNTAAYHTNDDNSDYEYIFNSDKDKNQTLDIISASKGIVENVGILTGGTNYKVNDRILFNNKGTSGTDAQGRVDRIDGAEVNYINYDSTSVERVEFGNINSLNQFIGFSTSPIPFSNFEAITISGLSTTYDGYSGISQARIGIRTDNFLLTLGVGSTAQTGLTTYFYITGDLNYPTLRENDILGIGTENIKVLNIDNRAKRIRVRREYDGISCGLAHTNRTVLFEDPRKFRLNVSGLSTSNALEVNKEYYFYPQEVVGVGTVGLGSTSVFSDPGVGIRQKFIPTQQIYIPGHGLDVNDRVYYNKQDGTAIGVWNGIGTISKTLDSYDFFYVAPVNNDFIGLSTNKIGMGTEGSFVGVGTTTSLLFFTSVPTDDYHSLKTDKDNVLTGNISKITVNVATSSTHGLEKNDTVYVSVKPTDTKEINVKYDNTSRRILFDGNNITTTNIIKNTLIVTGHDFVEGDKVLYEEVSAIGGLTDGKTYYIYPYDSNSLQLVEQKFELSKSRPSVVDITSTGTGVLTKINPPLEVKRNNKLKFNLGDSSLSFVVSGVRYPAYELRFYTDSEFSNVFDSTESTSVFEVQRTGLTGIDSDANVTITISDEVPTNLWYNFVPINNDIIVDVKNEIVVDTDVNSNNEISVIKTRYDGVHSITGVGDTTFSYNIQFIPDVPTYNVTNSVSTYETTSTNAYGPISRISMLDNGANYEVLPGISTVSTDIGSGAILKPLSNSIGKIQRVKFNAQNIGFDYPTDTTVRPIANPPEILELESLKSFESIGISSGGRNYLQAPDLVVLDGFTRNVVPDLDIFYHLGDTEVTILQNTTGLYDVTPEIIPINNSNGVGIASLTYTPSTKSVRLFFDGTFSDMNQFPYTTGAQIFVENLNVGVGSIGRGYNSEDYSYQFFTVTGFDAALGGTGGYVDYSLVDYLGDSDVPGEVDLLNSSGRVIAIVDFPIFDPKLKTNMFLKDEVVFYEDRPTGKVESWNPITETLKVDTDVEYEVGKIVKGFTSNTQGVINTKYDFDAEITTGAGTTVTYGWQRNTGFLNDNLQRTPNNEYYQNFSYSIKSRIALDTWEDPVSSLNHISGYDKFSDLQVESIEENPLGIAQPFDSDVDTTTDIISSAALYCFYDFDFVTENHFDVNGQLVSDEIYFENRILSDYFQSVGNRVLDIDDFSSTFFSNERQTPFSDVEAFEFNDVYNKIFTLVRDRIFTDERQSSIVSVIQTNSIGYMQEYATMETYPELGFFDYFATADGWNLQFYPVKTEFNTYDVSTMSISIHDNITSIGSTALGAACLLDTKRSTIADGVAGGIFSIPTSYRAFKALVLQEDENGEYASGEVNLIHDGTNVHMLEYGEMATKTGQYSSTSGFGTFGSRISGGQVILEFTPNVGTAVTCNTSIVALSDAATGISTIAFQESRLTSGYKSISASGSPSANTVVQFEEPYANGYYIVSVEDNTTNQYEMFEVVVIASESNESIVEWANIRTGGSIGQIGVTSTTGYTNLTYTPNANVDVEVRTFGIESKIFDDNQDATHLDLNNVDYVSGTGEYQGTKLELKTAFGLKHDGLPIFRRQFNGDEDTTFDFDENTLFLKEHFFVTGENVTYTFDGPGSTQAVGIAATTVAGVVTDKLPNDLFVVKIGDGSVRFAETAEKALRLNPEVFNFTSVGIGTSHHITAKKQNAKALIAIDNMIQAPISPTPITAVLNDSVVFDQILPTTGITSIAAADIIKIGEELMTVQTVGVGGEGTLSVLRGQMGTALQPHGIGSTITKVSGTYNIVDSTIHFVSPPYGAVPLSTTTGDPDNRDFTGLTTHSTFQGRTFMRSAPVNSDRETYFANNVFDDFSTEFTGIRSEFTLRSETLNTVGYSTDNAIILINNIFQEPQGAQADQGTYDLIENSGITSIRFDETGASFGYDPNRTNLPVGGFIISIGSTEGGGYQPLVSAGGTVTVSAGGSITAVSIGNSGSGYRTGLGTVFVGVQTSSTGTPNIDIIGSATVSDGHITGVTITNAGTGYTGTDLPELVIDEPASYTNIPLIYSSDSVVGSGQSATIDIQVGLGGSVVDYEIKYHGFAYGNKEILTVPVGGATGIPTSGTFSEFQITVDEIYSDQFNGFSIGQLQVLDNFNSQFDGVNKSFRLSINDRPLSIQSEPGSPVEVDKTLLIFINDVLQQPEVAYNFTGGGTVQFVEAPQQGDISKVLFYRGSGDIDVIFTDVLETVKVGDTLNINNNPEVGQGIGLDEDVRTVVGINTIDSVSTNLYNGPGITRDTTLIRPVTWCRQQIDKIINGQEVGKDRVEYEPEIYPTSYLIQPVGVGSTVAYVDSVRPLFNTFSESNDRDFQNKVKIVSQDSVVGASATAVVSGLGTISSISVTNVGAGYTQSVDVSIAPPLDGTTATAILTLNGDGVGVVTVTSPGTGYTNTQPPLVLIGEPTIIREEIGVDGYSGDFGEVVAIGASGSQQIYFDLFIPVNSFMRDAEYVGSSVTVSTLAANDYVTIFNTNLSIGNFESKDVGGSTLGISTTNLDNVYQVISSVSRYGNVPGVGSTVVQRITVGINTNSGLSDTSAADMGEFSWGKIQFEGRETPSSFNFYGTNGVVGISTGGVLSRFNPLKFTDYTA